jgi:hypothetical protein
MRTFYHNDFCQFRYFPVIHFKSEINIGTYPMEGDFRVMNVGVQSYNANSRVNIHCLVKNNSFAFLREPKTRKVQVWPRHVTANKCEVKHIA